MSFRIMPVVIEDEKAFYMKRDSSIQIFLIIEKLKNDIYD